MENISADVTGLHLEGHKGLRNDKHGLGSHVTLQCRNLCHTGILTMPKEINPSVGFLLPYHTITAVGAQRGSAAFLCVCVCV